MYDTPLAFWIGFNVFVMAMLALDLGIFHRKDHVVTLRESLAWVSVWTSMALAFGVIIYFWRGPQSSLEYITGYVIEESLSMDNLFVFLVIFHYFGVKAEHQYKVLFWGIIGAVVMRAGAIFAGVALLELFHWMIYVMGAFLVVTGIRTAIKSETEVHPDTNLVVVLMRKFIPIAEYDHSGRFVVRKDGRWMATPLMVVLMVINVTDLVFALDSIPAILGVTRDPFIVYTSNIFAILGLRALYFALAGLMNKLQFLHYGLAAVLVFVGLKMLAELAHVEIPILLSLGIVAGLLALSVIVSLLLPPKPEIEAIEKSAPINPD